MTAGLIVAGGYSTRFGIAEKALAEVGGEPMLRRAALALEPLVDDLVIDCRADQVEPFRAALEPLDVSPTFAIDPEPDGGPVVGLATGLAAIRERADPGEVLVLSCDRPGVTSDVLQRLRDRRVGADVAAAVPAVDGHIQPLCGSYRTRALHDACTAVRAAGRRQLTRVPHRLCHLAVPAEDVCERDDARALRSVDTPLGVATHPCRLPKTEAQTLVGSAETATVSTDRKQRNQA